MNRIKNAVLLFSVVIFFIGCRQLDSQIKRENKNTRAFFINKEIDLGIVRVGDSATHRFMLKNDGGNDLVIQNVKASCGCTTTAWTQYPVKPNDSAILDVSFHAQTPGYFRKSVVVQINSDTPYAVCYLKGLVEKS